MGRRRVKKLLVSGLGVNRKMIYFVTPFYRKPVYSRVCVFKCLFDTFSLKTNLRYCAKNFPTKHFILHCEKELSKMFRDSSFPVKVKGLQACMFLTQRITPAAP